MQHGCPDETLPCRVRPNRLNSKALTQVIHLVFKSRTAKCNGMWCFPWNWRLGNQCLKVQHSIQHFKVQIVAWPPHLFSKEKKMPNTLRTMQQLKWGLSSTVCFTLFIWFSRETGRQNCKGAIRKKSKKIALCGQKKRERGSWSYFNRWRCILQNVGLNLSF